jgi:hypothetical protein
VPVYFSSAQAVKEPGTAVTPQQLQRPWQAHFALCTRYLHRQAPTPPVVMVAAQAIQLAV